MTMIAFNAEVPLSQLSEALTFFKARGMLCGGIHLFDQIDREDESEKGTQVCIKGLTTANDSDWHAFCTMFRQDCVSLSPDNGKTGALVGPYAAKWGAFNPEFFSAV